MNPSYCNTPMPLVHDRFLTQFIIRYRVHKSNDYFTHVNDNSIEYILPGKYLLDMLITIRIRPKAIDGYHYISAIYANSDTSISYYKSGDNIYHDVTLRVHVVYRKTFNEHDMFNIMIYIRGGYNPDDYSIVGSNALSVRIIDY